MGRTVKISLLSALFCFSPPAQNSIEGSVVDSFTGTGIADVTVYFGSEKGGHYDATTDTSGRFQITGMKEGEYGSHFEEAGYLPQFSGTNDSGLEAVQVGRDPVRIRVELVAFATLRGRVLDPEGKPAAKPTVTLGLDTETTDDRGQFAFTKLVPGSYTMQASSSSLPLLRAIRPNTSWFVAGTICRATRSSCGQLRCIVCAVSGCRPGGPPHRQSQRYYLLEADRLKGGGRSSFQQDAEKRP